MQTNSGNISLTKPVGRNEWSEFRHLDGETAALPELALLVPAYKQWLVAAYDLWLAPGFVADH